MEIIEKQTKTRLYTAVDSINFHYKHQYFINQRVAKLTSARDKLESIIEKLINSEEEINVLKGFNLDLNNNANDDENTVDKEINDSILSTSTKAS